MKPSQIIFLLVISILLNACGGSSSGDNTTDEQIAEGGIGGTGISLGPVTGFGSIYVNGVRYQVDSAEFVRNDDVMFVQDDFSIGEFVTVTGSVDADGVNGTASRVEFNDLLRGTVTTASTDGIMIEIMGQTVITDQRTVLLGSSLLTDFLAGDFVQVSGYRNAAQEIIATSIQRTDISDYKVSGIVKNLNPETLQFQLQELTVDYAAAVLEADLQNEVLIVVEGPAAPESSLFTATEVELVSSVLPVQEEVEIEIEGLITRFYATTSFEVNGIPVITTEATEFEDGHRSQLALNVKVEIEGITNSSGEIIANEVELLESEDSIELEAPIEDISDSIITVLGKQVLTNAATIILDDTDSGVFQLPISALSQGDFVEITGNYLADGSILATRIDRENEDNDDESDEEIELEDKISSFDVENSQFVILGITVTVNAETEIEAEEDTLLSIAEFFAQLELGNDRLKVKAISDGDGGIIATEIEFED